MFICFLPQLQSDNKNENKNDDDDNNNNNNSNSSSSSNSSDNSSSNSSDNKVIINFLNPTYVLKSNSSGDTSYCYKFAISLCFFTHFLAKCFSLLSTLFSLIVLHIKSLGTLYKELTHQHPLAYYCLIA